MEGEVGTEDTAACEESGRLAAASGEGEKEPATQHVAAPLSAQRTLLEVVTPGNGEARDAARANSLRSPAGIAQSLAHALPIVPNGLLHLEDSQQLVMSSQTAHWSRPETTGSPRS